MQYAEVREIMDKKDLMRLSLEQNRPVKEIIKQVLSSDIEKWNRVHLEYGRVTNVREVRVENTNGSSYMQVEFITAKPDRNGGSYERSVKTDLKPEGTHDDMSNLVGAYVKLYVTYKKNKKDQSVFKELLDFEIMKQADKAQVETPTQEAPKTEAPVAKVVEEHTGQADAFGSSIPF